MFSPWHISLEVRPSRGRFVLSARPGLEQSCSFIVLSYRCPQGVLSLSHIAVITTVLLLFSLIAVLKMSSRRLI